ncbi:MAG: hypothetical protein KDA05_09875 [Phycisphaerales bacterium]|nr:hypothetical protein [Phycisphaerales bacterium]
MGRATATILRHAFLPAAILALMLGALLVWSLWGAAYRRFDVRPAPGAAPDPSDPTGVRHEYSDLTFVLDRGELWITNAGTYYAPGFQTLHAGGVPSSVGALRWWPYQSRFLQEFGHGMWSFHLPVWLAMVPSMVLASIAQEPWRAHGRRRRRRAKSQCERCAYDRAGLDSAVAPCPECGHAPSILAAPRPHDPDD